jgi:hypothetical protein
MQYQDYWDSTMNTCAVLPNDTVKALMIFSYAPDGIQNDTMKVMFDGTSDIWSLSDSGSISNYYLQTSFNKHFLEGFSAPERDTMIIGNVDCNMSLQNYYQFDEAYFDDIMAQADSLYDFRDFDMTGPQG